MFMTSAIENNKHLSKFKVEKKKQVLRTSLYLGTYPQEQPRDFELFLTKLSQSIWLSELKKTFKRHSQQDRIEVIKVHIYFNLKIKKK